MPITALPDPYGIGTLGKGAYAFVDYLKKAGQRYWQILPIGITSFGDSPYQSFSAFAGNPYWIDIEALAAEHLLTTEELHSQMKPEGEPIAYAWLFRARYELLKKAHSRLDQNWQTAVAIFVEQEKEWLKPFALFMALKEAHGYRPWYQWALPYKLADQDALDAFSMEHLDTINFWYFTQYCFFKHYDTLKAYANASGIGLIGDIPIYVAEDSVELWLLSDMFKLDAKHRSLTIAGCPPDAFSATGQLWGNPIYNWESMKERGYPFWVKRLKQSLTVFDILRIDHFRGFEAYWSIPSGELTAVNGRWIKGPGHDLFSVLKEALGELPIIAEDLGYITKEVQDLRDDFGFPGMKVMQFAFDTREESDYLPHNYPENCVVYTGTHDNDTLQGWMKSADPLDVEHAKAYLKLDEVEGYHWGFIRGAWSSVAKIAIVPMHDLLGLGSEARINIPSTIGGNWTWRIKPEDLDLKTAEQLLELTKRYGRIKNVKHKQLDK
jgi:4-alpha-glucanotransferase